MAKARKPERAKAQAMWEESQGKVPLKDIAQTLHVKVEQVRKWKNQDKWPTYPKAKVPTKRKGGQQGNQNAKDHGAPQENKNAETHGAYSTPRLKDLPQHQQNYIKALGADVRGNLEAELTRLLVKEADLENKIAELKQCSSDTLHVERVVEVEGGEYEGTTTTRESSFERIAKLEAMSSRVHGQLLKAIDAIKAYENEERRHDLDKKKHNITVQKLTGEYVINQDTGMIDDTTDGQGEDLEL